MKSILVRIFTLFSLVVLLIVANVGVRIYEWTHSTTSLDLAIPKLALLDLGSQVQPEISSSSFVLDHYNQQTYLEPVYGTKIAHRSKPLPRIEFKKIDKRIDIFEEAWGDVEIEINQAESWKEIRGDVAIPTIENFEIKKIELNAIENTKLIALFNGFKFNEKVLVAEIKKEEAVPVVVAPVFANIKESIIIQDKVSTLTAKSVDVDPEYFEYESEGPAQDLVQSKQASGEVLIEKKSEVFDYSQPAPVVSSVDNAEIAKENVEFFNLIRETKMPSKAPNKKTQARVIPKVAVTSQTNAPREKQVSALVSSQNAMTVVHGLSVSSQIKELRYFDLKAVDDGQTIVQDNGTGEIVLKENIQSINNSRSFLLLNREHVVTHVDVPFAPGRADLTVPALEKDFAEKFQVRDHKIPRGIVLIELDEKTENITLDGAKYSSAFLDEKFKNTKAESATYVMFYGVEVGNRTLVTTDSRGKNSQRIIHVFEEEITFDPNLYLDQKDLVLTLKEEDLMSQKGKDLAISTQDVSLTLSNISSERIGTNTYKLKAPALLMGSRHYVTLRHQREEIFVGVDTSKTVLVPSEDLISAVIRKFKLQGHSSACLIQVNLDRPAKKYDVMAESHQETHVSYALVLDKDGGFYESIGEDSKKLFIMSESQAGEAFTQNAKINIKIEYLDGSSKSFSSFCSPNAYLVEQL